MHDSIAISQEGARWLLLVHHIPPKPDYLRVKVRRRLHHVGALALKNSVYVLPNTDDAVEDFQWIRRMVVDGGGEAILCCATFVDGLGDREVESMFRAQSDAEFGDIIAAAHRVAADPTEADIQRLARRLDRAAARDYFASDRAADAERAVRAAVQTPDDSGPPGRAPTRALDVPRGATWVTRTGVKVDRIASAWLIRRFIDRDARFRYVEPTSHRPAAGELRFDMFEGEFTHEGDACTFEVLLHRFGLDDPALEAIGEIVHDIDCKDAKFGRPEGAGISSLIRGLRAAHAGDDDRIAAGATMLDGLYAALQRAEA